VSNFIERNAYELSAQIRLYRNPKTELEFEIFPMVHIATAEFYAIVQSHLEQCDAIFYEGIRSKRVRVITSAYRILTKRPRLGLVTQSQALDLSTIREKVILADQDRQTFEANWSKLPWSTRVLISVISPLYGGYLFLTMTRGRLAKIIDPSNLPASESLEYVPDEPDPFEEVIGESRDRHFISQLAAFFEQNRGKRLRAGVAFGAAHAEPVGAFLSRKLRYHVASAKRVLLFSL
jgi:hypothetical protein